MCLRLFTLSGTILDGIQFMGLNSRYFGHLIVNNVKVTSYSMANRITYELHRSNNEVFNLKLVNVEILQYVLVV